MRSHVRADFACSCKHTCAFERDCLYCVCTSTRAHLRALTCSVHLYQHYSFEHTSGSLFVVQVRVRVCVLADIICLRKETSN